MEDLLNGWRKRHELIELLVPANYTATELQIPDIPNLRDDTTQDIIVVGLETYAAETMPNAPSGNPVAAMSDLQNIYLTLYIEEEESVRNLPMPRLQPIWQSLQTGTLQGGQATLALENLKVTWNKSFLKFGEAPADNDAFTVLLCVWYKKLAPGMWNQLMQQAGYVKGW